MSESRRPILDTFYQNYLANEDCPQFIKSVSEHYSLATLQRLAKFGPSTARRGAILAIGFLGEYSCNSVLGNALLDSDRAVRLLAEHGIRRIWFRQGSEAVQKSLGIIQRLVWARDFEHSIEKASAIIETHPEISEAWNQRAVAWFSLEKFAQSLTDCRRTLRLNHFHFSAAIGVGHCFLKIGKPRDAIKGFQHALAINPNLESVRLQMKHLKKNFEQK